MFLLWNRKRFCRYVNPFNISFEKWKPHDFITTKHFEWQKKNRSVPDDVQCSKSHLQIHEKRKCTQKIKKTLLFFRCYLCCYLVVRGNSDYRNGMWLIRTNWKRKLPGNWSQPFWLENRKCARSWNGRIAKSFIKGERVFISLDEGGVNWLQIHWPVAVNLTRRLGAFGSCAWVIPFIYFSSYLLPMRS